MTRKHLRILIIFSLTFILGVPVSLAQTGEPTPSPLSAPTTIVTATETTNAPTNHTVATCDLAFAAEPERASAGTQIVLSGQGFGTGALVNIGLVLPNGEDSQGQAIIGLPGQQASPAGAVAFTYRTEVGDPAGLYQVVIEERGSGCQTTATFFLEASATPTPVQMTINVEATSTHTETAIPTQTPTPTPVSLMISRDPLLTNIKVQAWIDPVFQATSAPSIDQDPTPTATVTPSAIRPGQGGGG